MNSRIYETSCISANICILRILGLCELTVNAGILQNALSFHGMPDFSRCLRHLNAIGGRADNIFMHCFLQVSVFEMYSTGQLAILNRRLQTYTRHTYVLIHARVGCSRHVESSLSIYLNHFRGMVSPRCEVADSLLSLNRNVCTSISNCLFALSWEK